jgi:hypothetical protein
MLESWRRLKINYYSHALLVKKRTQCVAYTLMHVHFFIPFKASPLLFKKLGGFSDGICQPVHSLPAAL